MRTLSPSLLLLTAASLTATITACGPRRVMVNGVEMSYDDGAKKVLAEADEARAAGDNATAKVRYKEVIELFEDSDKVPAAYASLGDLLFEEGGCAASRMYLETLAEKYPLSPHATVAKQKLGACEGGTQQANENKEIAALGTQYREAGNDAQRKDIASTAADASIAGGDFAAAVRWLLKVYALEKDDAQKQATKNEIAELIDARVSHQDVRQLMEEIGGKDFPMSLLTYKLGRIQYHTRDLENCRETLQRYLATWPGTPEETGAKQILALIDARGKVNPRAVGVLMPLSGKNRAYGEAALQAVQLALGEDKTIKLVVRDTKSDRVAASIAAQELALQEGAIAIIGPMFTNETEPAAIKAQELGVPLLTISSAEQIGEVGPYVFRNGLTNAAQAKALVHYAMDVAGLKSFAILYPRHPYGEELMHLFWDEVDKRKGEIRGIESYGTEDTTFAEQVKSLVARDVVGLRSDYRKAIEECDKQADNYRKSRCKERVSADLKPLVDFDGLFIPDYPRQISMISAALAFEDIIVETDPKYLRKIEKTLDRKVKPVTLLGASGWNSPELPEKAERNVENAVFTDAFFAGSDDKHTAQFVGEYQKKYRRTPTVVEALAYDSAMIIKQVMTTANPATRDAMREAMRQVADFRGVTGKTSFAKAADAEKEIRILTIKDGKIQEVDLPENASRNEEPQGTQ